MSARTTANPGRRIYLGEAIVEEIRSTDLTFEPLQFEFWFAYKSKRNAAMNTAADAIIAEKGALAASDIRKLHESYLSPWRMVGAGDDIAARLAGKLEELNLTLDTAIGSVQEQRESFAAEIAELSADTARTLKDVLGTIGRLSQGTKENQARFGLLESRVDAMNREIGAIKKQLSIVRTECRTDPTTELPNRAAFDGGLSQVLMQAAATRQPASVLLCDIDYFSAFNENFGNFVGDQVLRAIGMLFRSHMRPTDLVARFESDCFAAIMPQTRGSDAVACGERFRQALIRHELVPHPNGAGRVTASIGVSDAIKGDTPEFLLRRALNGLKVAKKEGRNRVVEMTPDGPLWNMERCTK